MLKGGYGAYHAVMIHVAADGKVAVSDDQDIYVTPGAMATQANMRLYSRDPSTFDPLWPGVYPETLAKMIVNVKLDMFPEVGSTMSLRGKVVYCFVPVHVDSILLLSSYPFDF